MLLSTAATAQVDPVVAQAMSDLAAGKADAAYRALAPLAAERAGEPDFDFTLGLAAADSGRPAEAIVALQRVLAVQPDNAKARAELARAYALGGDIDTARSQFDTVVQDPSLPDPVRQRFDRIVRDYDRQIAGGGTDVSGFLDASAGWDSNINTATDLTQITIPLFAAFGPGALGPGSRATDKGYYEVTGGVSVVSAISRQTRVFGSVLGNWHDNIDSAPFDQAAATGTAGLAHTLADRSVVSVSGQFQQFWLGGNSFRQAGGVIAQYTIPQKGGAALSFSGQFFRLNYDNDPLRDANRYAGAVSYAGRDFIATVSAGHDETRRAAGDHLSNTFGRLSLGSEYALGGKIAFVAGVSGELRGYDAPDPLFLLKRQDQQIDASIGLKIRLSDNLYARPRVTYTRNWSNIALYDYDRFTGGVGIRLEF
ncbi:MAG: tetratricopeptide repeat protein [Sphingomonadales bacterium]|nr:MAG: tetratricopeptide repeat protein [Sphingomonadales bacterium]